MSQIRSKHTSPEKVVRGILRAIGIRYRLDSGIHGKPDLKVVGQRTVIFIDGCFWHRCPDHFQAPKANRKFWNEKLEKNVKRDKAVSRELRRRGYHVIRLWEHETKKPERLIKKLAQKISK